MSCDRAAAKRDTSRYSAREAKQWPLKQASPENTTAIGESPFLSLCNRLDIPQLTTYYVRT
jgi:hypothetical protein